ncbi:MAG: hypothetical protein ACRDOX_05975 [Nocardioides sp.]
MAAGLPGAAFFGVTSSLGFRGGSFALGEDFRAGFFLACGFGATFFATSAGVTGASG